MNRPQSAPAEAQPRDELALAGIGVSPGIVRGPALVHAAHEMMVEGGLIDPSEVPAQLQRFGRARSRSRQELKTVACFAREKLGETSAAIFEAQAMILDDEVMIDQVETLIREDLFSADNAIQDVLNVFRIQIEGSASDHLRERAGDLLDVQARLIRNLRRARAMSRIEPDHIVVAEFLTAADLLLFSQHSMLGVALESGGATSHVAIMARSLGLPTVVGLHDLADRIQPGDEIILDGFAGRVVVNPGHETRTDYERKSAAYQQRIEARLDERHLPATTVDGTEITLQANVDLEAELDALDGAGAQGVGLFRTEMLLLAKGRPLDEEEQLAVYRKAVEAAHPHPTTFRLVDLGGDKLLPMAHREENPSLGWRGVRILLDRPDVVRPQMRALMRVAVEGPIRVLIPMVSSIDEVRRIRETWLDVARELRQEGIEHDVEVPLGIMVEVPAVALAAGRFAREVDFMSIGTNDLTQFLLAVDRGNDMVADRFQELQPALLRLIAEVVQAGEQARMPVSICGELAANPRMAPLLVGLGLRALSASPTFLPDLKLAIRSTSLADARALAAAALEQPDARSVRTLIEQWVREHLFDLAPYFEGNLSLDAEHESARP